MKGQMMALKEQVKARYRLSDLIRAQKNDKMTSNLSKWIQTGVKEKGDLEEDSYKILSQFYKERKDLLYHTEENMRRRYYTSTTSYTTSAVPGRSVFQIVRPDGTSGDRQSTTKNTAQI